jgi:hypothetical protein
MPVHSARPPQPRKARRAPRYPRTIVTVAGLALMVAGCRQGGHEGPAGVMPISYQPGPDAGPATPSSFEPAPSATAAASAASVESTGLTAVLSSDGAVFPSSVEGSLTVTIRNDGDQPATLRMDVIGSSILALDVFDAQGQRIPTIPPPMPLTPTQIEQTKETLAPGQSRQVSTTLHMFSPPLPAGTYRVRMREMASNEASFTIQPGR